VWRRPQSTIHQRNTFLGNILNNLKISLPQINFNGFAERVSESIQNKTKRGITQYKMKTDDWIVFSWRRQPNFVRLFIYNYTHVLNYMYVYNPGKRLSSLIPAHANYHNRTHTHTNTEDFILVKTKEKETGLNNEGRTYSTWWAFCGDFGVCMHN
jgi:hypothetical protein